MRSGLMPRAIGITEIAWRGNLRQERPALHASRNVPSPDRDESPRSRSAGPPAGGAVAARKLALLPVLESFLRRLGFGFAFEVPVRGGTP